MEKIEKEKPDEQTTTVKRTPGSESPRDRLPAVRAVRHISEASVTRARS